MFRVVVQYYSYNIVLLNYNRYKYGCNKNNLPKYTFLCTLFLCSFNDYINIHFFVARRAAKNIWDFKDRYDFFR